MEKKYRSHLSGARNLGSAGSGSHHWWQQRLTALILVITTFWVVGFFSAIRKSDISSIIASLQKPYNLVMLLVVLGTMMYHGVLGVQVVIEDYVSCRASRLVLSLTTKIFAIITMVAFVVCIGSVIR